MVEGSEGNTSTRRFRHVNMLGSVKSMNLITRDIEKVRSLFFHPSSFIPQDLFTSLKAVRSLKLSNCGLLELPQEIGDLIHIRLLDVSKNQFTELPESICNLHYLQSLYVDECEKLGQLPQRFGDLVHLRHLYMDETNQLKKMPQEIEKLTSLRTLGKFIVDDDEPANNIVKLKKLNHLESLNMHVHRDVDFENAELGDKIYLDWLKLVFEGEGFDSGNKSLLETMEPPPNLKELFIFNYPAIHLPKWILAQTLVNNLKYLHLCGAHSVSSLPSLWKFQSLQVLTLEFLLNLKCFGREFYGLPNDFQPKVFRKDGVANVVAFPSLKSLTLRQLSLETWEDISEEDDEKLSISIMPRLQNLGVQSCNKLNSLPHRIVGKASSLKWLHIHTCKTLEERYSKNTKEDWRKLSPAPAVRIL
ncbi:OLC1v1008962C1, partial [Oldenlandia corymbosa var. corymbosa]